MPKGIQRDTGGYELYHPKSPENAIRQDPETRLISCS
jgi:hypothetical protein